MLAEKFYLKPNWINSKTGCNYPLSCWLSDGLTNWQALRKNIHHKKRYIAKLQKQIAHLKKAPLRVKVPKSDIFLVGSKDETCGNQVCQWDGDLITIRVPKCLESNFGTHVQSRIGNFGRKILAYLHLEQKHGTFIVKMLSGLLLYNLLQ
ncbi:MAG: hypothetical protein KME64_23595 [Scytonematopsis contorta HA4267-MV1]|nr:hypothetical protein [Scytonematopsis contorta HA4267-MV1]